MGDALQRLLERKRQQIIALQSQDVKQLLENKQSPTSTSKQEENRSPRHLLLQQVKKMYAKGKGAKTIARILHISRNTVKKYIHLHEPCAEKWHQKDQLNQL